jgi:hypothetical protein
MTEWPQYYILVGRIPVAVDLMTWARWFENTGGRRVAETIVDDTPTEVDFSIPGREQKITRPKVRVSTVFLGLDHNYRSLIGEEGAEPLIFETMIFGGPLDQETWRYSTYDQAERGHDEAVTQARKAGAQIKAIADASRSDK